MTQVQAPAHVTLGKSLNMPDLVSLSIKNGNNGTCHLTVLMRSWNDTPEKDVAKPLRV